MRGPPPLRFLAVVLGGWVCARGAVLAPDWLTETSEAGEKRNRPGSLDEKRALEPERGTIAAASALPAPASPHPERLVTNSSPAADDQPEGRPATLALSFTSGQVALAPAVTPAPAPEEDAVGESMLGPRFESSIPAPGAVAATLEAGPDRLAVSGWAVVRGGSEPQLATGGVLGGSQAGVRLTYRMTQSLSLSGRLSSPLEDDGAEAAIGVEWQPSRSVPIKLLAERRQAIGDGGRSDFALVAHGGVSDVKVAGPVVAEAYVQAGVVGARERDAFADGAVKLGVPVGGGVRIGAGAWGAAQPGVARLDVGPQVTMTLPGGPATLRVSAEWRVRVAGDAEPGSGPALTVATSF